MTAIIETPLDQEEPAIRIPSLPDEPPANGFPVLMTVAPVVVALILFALLRTPYVLMFAILGPVLGTANVIDQRIGRRRRRRRALTQFSIDATAAEREIADAHARVVARRRTAHPLAADLIAGMKRVEPGIVVGTTTVPSGIRIEGAGSDERSQDLVMRATRLTGIPITAESDRFCVQGPRAEVSSAVRALIVQLLTDRLDAKFAVASRRDETVTQEICAAGLALSDVELADVCVCVHSTVNDVERCSGNGYAAIEISESGSGVLSDSSGKKVRIQVDSLSAAMFARWLPKVATAQQERERSTRALPRLIELGDLEPSRCGHLGSTFLYAEDGPYSVDLVGDGPHALIGGTTGSGKSELLIAWATGLAASNTSEECTFLCIDFKGGATFDSIAGLPHCVGVVTDLDDDEALRVGASLRSEVRRRELVLRDLGVRDIAELDRGIVPRLVVFVDEFQALVETHPDLQDVFHDVGARGRSLGIHLVLCTQRPTGVFRESLLANAAIRLCLRVEQPSDSSTLLGNPAATELGRDLRGRCLVRTGSNEVTQVQTAIARPALIEAIAARENASRRSLHLAEVRRPWHPPLPELLELDGLMHEHLPGSIPFGLGDSPEHQQQPVMSIDRPGQHLFVVGTAETGKSQTLNTLERSARNQGIRIQRISADVEDAWDGVEALLTRPSSSWTLVLIDDVDTLEQQFADEHRHEWLERLQRLLRTGTRLNLSVVLTARRVSGALQRLRGLCADTLFFNAPSKQEWIMQGGEASHWHAAMPPGRGRLGSLLLQVAVAEPRESATTGRAWARFEVPDSGMIVTGRRLGPVRDSLSALGHPVAAVPTAAAARSGDLSLELNGQVLIGEHDQWNAAYGTLPKFAEHVPVLSIGLTPGEWRSTFRGDALYPAVDDSFTRGLLRMPNGRVARVQLEEGRPTVTQEPRTGGL